MQNTQNFDTIKRKEQGIFNVAFFFSGEIKNKSSQQIFKQSSSHI